MRKSGKNDWNLRKGSKNQSLEKSFFSCKNNFFLNSGTAFLTMIVTAGHYIARQNLNFTITVMTDPPATEFDPVCSSVEDLQLSESTSSNTSNSEISSDIFTSRKKYNWTTAQYGSMLGAFYIGYCAAVFPGALVAQKFGFHPAILFVCFGNALASFFFPILVDYSHTAGIIARIMLGLTSGPIMPAIQVKIKIRLLLLISLLKDY